MSGGVDSSVTAALLKKEGYDVIGVTMQVWSHQPEAEETGRFGGCCSLQAVEDARRVAEIIGIPHYVLNFRQVFKEKVIDYFCQEYQAGRTPNPCIRCNQLIKFSHLLSKAREFEADFIATGHYARIEFDSKRQRYLLKRGIDQEKDQSYVLYTLTQEQLPRILFPLGQLHKAETRQLAKELNLPVAEKTESQDICFIPDNDCARFLKDYLPDSFKPGPIVDSGGNVIGTHRGILFYTVGQRKGLGINQPLGEKKPMKPYYVIKIDKKANTIIAGSEEELYSSSLIAEKVNWIPFPELKGPIEATAKIRYKAEEAAVFVSPHPAEASWAVVRFAKPQKAITPGQSVVFYQGELVLGGSIIADIFS